MEKTTTFPNEENMTTTSYMQTMTEEECKILPTTNYSSTLPTTNYSSDMYYVQNDTGDYTANYIPDDYYDGNYDYRPLCVDNTSSFDQIPSYWLCIIVLLPIICAIGIIGITLTVIVLSRKNMSTSTNCYLISLAVADLCFLLLTAPKCFESYITTHEQFKSYETIMTFALQFIHVFLLASVWLTVMLAIERYIAICHPLRAMSICSVVRARIIIVVIFAIALIFYFPNFFKFKLVTHCDPCLGKFVYSVVTTDLGNSQLYRTIFSWADLILCAVLPFSTLLFLNGCLIREIHRSTNYLRYHLASDSNVQTIITSEEIKITMMLISVIVVFFICQAPYVLLAIIKNLRPDTLFHYYYSLTHVTILLLGLRSTFNFILYCWFSEKFWNTFKKTFCMFECILKFSPNWFRSRVLGNNSEQGHSNNNPGRPGDVALSPIADVKENGTKTLPTDDHNDHQV